MSFSPRYVSGLTLPRRCRLAGKNASGRFEARSGPEAKAIGGPDHDCSSDSPKSTTLPGVWVLCLLVPIGVTERPLAAHQDAARHSGKASRRAARASASETADIQRTYPGASAPRRPWR
jgi:hypothetical protein